MNENRLNQIFSHYIDQFERINTPGNGEYYKWQIIKRFHNEMNDALAATAEKFPSMLYSLKKLSDNLIDSYTQPFNGLVKFAEKEPETVRQMFLDLYQEDGGNLDERQKRVYDFLVRSHALRDKYYPDSYLYKDDMHSVTGYLFLYDPDHNYIFKATHAQIFADCVEFYQDWGSGDTVDLKIYYRMCDELVEAIKKNEELMATDASRFDGGWGEDPNTLYPDSEKHILAFDLIYCCSTYGLYDGITFSRPKSKERHLMQERKEKAIQLSCNLEEARINFKELSDAKKYLNTVFAVGEKVHHKKYGDGVVQENNGTYIKVDFPNVGEKQLKTTISAAKGIISSDAIDYAETILGYKKLLEKEDNVLKRVEFAKKELEPYKEYLD